MLEYCLHNWMDVYRKQLYKSVYIDHLNRNLLFVDLSFKIGKGTFSLSLVLYDLSF